MNRKITYIGRRDKMKWLRQHKLFGMSIYQVSHPEWSGLELGKMRGDFRMTIGTITFTFRKFRKEN